MALLRFSIDVSVRKRNIREAPSHMNKLYKYRAFGVYSLSELCDSNIFFADPKIFNDPLDCSPTLVNDLKLDETERLAHRIYLLNSNKSEADKEIGRCRYMSTEYGDYKFDRGARSYYIRILERTIKHQLDLKMKSRGILSMATKWNSPLMWSHYADEHKGICIEYDITKSVGKKPMPVDYNGERGISLSNIFEYIFNSSLDALNEIEHKYFYTKASQWSYEEEWRLVSERQGLASAPFHLSAIYFGMRCPYPVISAIVKLFYGSGFAVDFYHAYASQIDFEILRSEVEVGELMATTPRPSIALAFGPIPTDDNYA